MLLIVASCHSNNEVVSSVKSNQVFDKYADILKVQSNQLTDVKLYNFIDSWYGVKYKYGGMTKAGVDCSGFCNVLYSSVYNKELPRTSKDIAQRVNKTAQDKLQQGDLVVFNIAGKKNSHVGLYLANGYFVHASSSKGVIISSLSNPYYKKAYNKGGGIK